LKIINTRERVSATLQRSGFQVIPSQANFIFVSNRKYPGRVLFQSLRDKGILVRYFDKPKIDNFIRVSIGTDEEMDRFLDVITARDGKFD
jgi:histidinol-phosphate aminotransferase